MFNELFEAEPVFYLNQMMCPRLCAEIRKLNICKLALRFFIKEYTLKISSYHKFAVFIRVVVYLAEWLNIHLYLCHLCHTFCIISAWVHVPVMHKIVAFLFMIYFGKIAKIVPELLGKGQVRPCIFVWANLVLEL